MNAIYIKKHRLSEAEVIALEVWKKLKMHCPKGKCKIAGSIRRRKKEVKDIEIVCVPNRINGDFFGFKKINHPAFVKAVKGIGKVTTGNIEDGKQVKIELYQHDIKIDLFMVEEGNFGMQFLIRTGPSEYSRKILWKFNQRGYRCEGGYPANGKNRLAFFNEKEIFEFLEMKYVEPEKRKG
ncbi:MAG: hypothetical protein AAFZ15_32400 [Bacteroidota bacterium]